MNSSPRRAAAALRPLLASLFFLLPAGARVGAQTAGRPPQAAALPAVLAPSRPPASERIILLRLADAPDGARFTVASDAPLDDYSTRFDGDSFHLLIPHSRAPGPRPRSSGGGFTSALVEQRGGDVLLSFRMQTGASMQISKGFNRLELNFKAARPAAEAAG